jgi:hypothetical protein
MHILGVKRASTKEANIRFSVSGELDFPICPIRIDTVRDGNKRKIGNISGIELK